MTVSLRHVGLYPNEFAFPLLYDLLKERDDTINVEHTELPSYEDHVAYCLRHGLIGRWWFVLDGDEIVGMVECRKDNAVGIFIFKKHQGKGYGPRALEALISEVSPHRDRLRSIKTDVNIAGRGPFLARINAKNARSIAMFEKAGFKLKSLTYELA